MALSNRGATPRNNIAALGWFATGWGALVGFLVDGRDVLSLGVFYFWLLKRFARTIFAVLFLVFAILFILGFVENINQGFYAGVIASLFNSLDLFANFLPFVFILATILFFSDLQEKSELTAARVLAFSPWRVVAPALSFSLLFGIFYIFAFSPVTAWVHQRWKNIDDPKPTATVELIDKEFWLKEKFPTGIFANSIDEDVKNFDGSIIIHGFSVIGKERKLKDAQFFLIGDDGNIKMIFLAKEALLNNNQWEMTNVTRYKPGQPVINVPSKTIPSQLNTQSIKDLLLRPEDLSIYKLSNYLEEVENLGFSTYPYDIYFNRLVSLPFVFMAMTLLAAGFSFQYKSRGQRIQTTLVAIILGFFIHFFFEIMRAFIISQELPAFLTAWLPTMMILLLSLALFLHREEH
ncbi:MAG: LptF/LptG family permease [Hydrotalea sp.]|nr:LptF/LptG family permease [Hydrotalea sp.]